MYEAFPYPSPIVGNSVIDDVANCLYSIFGEQSLDGWRILDAGCGTGHRLVGVARRYPGAYFTGIDMTEASLGVADQLARHHGVKNLRLQRDNLLDLQLRDSFDLVISTGVVHHLEDPQRGLQNLTARLSARGLLVVWLYNSVGEHDRLMARELLHLMWRKDAGIGLGVQMMKTLGLHLETKRYGSTGAQKGAEVSQLNIDVDAYVHPIVNAYTFAESISMLNRCEGVEWAAINNINLVDESRLIDLSESEDSGMRYFCQTVDALFDDEDPRARFREMDVHSKLRVMEIKLKPTGFTVLAGRRASLNRLGPRISGNAISFVPVRASE
jgi:SAM-dependent methyltransferase